MLSRERLARLHRELQDEPVLSVYLNTDQHDPALRSAWRTRLQRTCREVRQGLGEGASAVTAFDRALEHVEATLPADGFLPGCGYVAFATAASLQHSEEVPFPVPDLVLWEAGPHVAPYFGGMRHLRPAVVVVADRRHARVLRFREGALEETPGLVAFADVGDVSESAMAKRAARSTGVRGATGRDLAQRFLEVEAERLHHEAVERATAEAGRDGLLLLGGPGETTARLNRLVDGPLAARTAVAPGLALDMELSRMEPLVRDAVSALTRKLQEGLLEEVLAEVRPDGRGRTGTRDTRKMLREQRAELLLISGNLHARESRLTEQLVQAALDQNAEIEVLEGPAAERLDRTGEGLAVRLRY
ncbi:MAG: hypothetical protein RQ751_00180 [Longimicrobiales bacterium]|nr:hypothetical protein [Longimicrobiales bacterium]